MNKNKKARFNTPRGLLAKAVGAAALALVAAPASAISIDSGNPDISMRWDNTLKYNLGWRMEGRDNTLANSSGYDTSTLYRDKHDLVTNRFDILSEFDFVYRDAHGFRVSAAGWNDFAYDDEVEFNPAFGGSPYPNNRFTSNVERYYKRGGEILDAFVFTRIDAGDMPINIRAGRHNVYWGESLFTFGDSIAYGQGPLDLRKATSTPGIEAKELFLPQTQLSASMLVNDSVSLAANYFFEWDPHRLPDGGTYLGASNVSLLGGQNLGLPYVGNESSGPYRTPDNRGSWGLNAQIRSDALNGNVGLYYRNFDDRMPFVLLDAVNGVAYNAYAEDVKLYGISYNRLVGSVSVGAELSYRQDAALASVGFGPDIARGNTWHGLVNFIAYVGKTGFFDSAPLQGELTYSRLGSVNSGSRANFAHEDYACTGGIKAGCATDDAWGMNLAFTPTWFQVFPGIDLTMPMNFGYGLKGNSPAPLGATEGSGSWSVGLEADIYAQYTVGLAYTDYFGDWVREEGQVVAANGNALLHDRGWLSLTFKTTF
ncbi:DUF1302 domain-containing protein [Stutzerimonas tarimensis]|uniref:DUF1302 domain-containing protein n=1 Tax=Stutzerimonas tarimensis TaxID=1507735 RepID=A0ABV7T726_9GAMM